MNCNELSTLISRNSDSIAFLVGNGIHNYEICVKGVKEKVSWKDLLEKIKNGKGVNSLVEMPQEGITNPEYFDLIELLYIQQQILIEKNGLDKSIKSCVNSATKLSLQHNSPLPCSCETRYIKKKIDDPISSYFINENVLRARLQMDERTISILNDFGFFHAENIATYDQMSIAEDLQYGNIGKFYLIKRDIKELFKDYSLQDWILPFLNFAYKEQIPIMTTNYDEAMSKKLGLTLHCKALDSNTQLTFPFETYFSDIEIGNPWKSFAIWHINGLTSYPQSIKIGYLDYANMFKAIYNKLYISEEKAEIFSFLKGEECLCSTWISIFFYRDIFIFGLGLDEDEYVLRWLLIQRARFNILYQRNLKGWYIHRKNDIKPISLGKRLFLQHVGFEIIECDDEDIYENVWLQIIKTRCHRDSDKEMRSKK